MCVNIERLCAVVMGQFLWDDSGGQAIGWREIDFEICGYNSLGPVTQVQT